MPNVLNYKYEIFPTRPQRAQINRVLREARIQWNKAVTVRKKLKKTLVSGQLEHVLKTCLSANKSNKQGQRKRAILKFTNSNPYFQGLDIDSAGRLYDIKNDFGSVLKEVTKKYLDVSILTEELRKKYYDELNEWRKAKRNGKGNNLPKRKTFWALMGAINKYAGIAAKKYMDESFKTTKGMSLSGVRANISGYKTSIRWNQAVNPKKGQRAYGATGSPQYKRRANGFTYQIPQNTDITQLLRKTKKSNWQINLKVLHEGNRWVNAAYHRPIPDGGSIKQVTINERTGRYFAVLSVEVPNSVWKIEPTNTNWNAGIDPGAQTALTVALKNSKSNELKYLCIHYEFLEKSLKKLEKMQQSLESKTGRRRKRTEKEIKDALSKFANKSKIKKLSNDEKEKAIAKEKGRLERTMLQQKPSRRWIRWSKRVSALQYKIACRRADVLHKISRALAEGCSIIGIGNWEPERQISYRKKIRAAKKKVRQGIQGAEEELKNLETAKSKQGPKGSVKKRRSGRDRAIATFRKLIEEKAQRAGACALTRIDEAGSTYTCCVCGAKTGPKGPENLSVRKWKCKKCNAEHNRDLNSAFNIMKKAVAQTAIPATESIVAKTTTHGAEPHPGFTNSRKPARGSENRGDLSHKNRYRYVSLWKENVPKSLSTLIDMKIVRSLQLSGSEKMQNPLGST